MNPNISEFSGENQKPSLARKTYFWFRVYCAVLVLIYIVLAIFGAILVVVQPESKEYDKTMIILMGAIYLILGILLFLVFAVGLFLPRRKWGWIYGMVLICIGMSSCCFMPACIPLLINWMKPEMKAFFSLS